MNVEPLHDKILVRRHEANREVAVGIIAPESAIQKPQEGDVLATGTGRILDDGTVVPLVVKVGDVVLFAKYGGTEVEIDGEEVLVMREDEVLAIRRS